MNKSMVFSLIAITFVALALGYNFLKVNVELTNTLQEKNNLQKTLTVNKYEIEGLKASLGKKQNELGKPDKELSQLSYNQGIKNSLFEAKDTLDQISTQLDAFKREIAPKEASSMEVRVQDSTREIQHLLKDLKEIKEEFANLIMSKEKISSDFHTVDSTKELAALKDKLWQTEREKVIFEDQLKDVMRREEELNILNRNLQTKLAQLSNKLGQKEKRMSDLEARLGKTKSISEVEAKALQAKVAAQRGELKKIATLYNNLKDQLKEIAKILTRREEEFQEKERQINTLKDEVSYLKLNLSNLENSLQQSQENQKLVAERLSEVTDLNKSLQERLKEISGILGKRSLPQPSSKEEPAIKTSIIEEKKEKDLRHSQSQEQKGKDKIDEIKKKVEVILQPSQDQ